MVITTYIYNPKALPSEYKYGKFVKTGNTYAFQFSGDLLSLASRDSLGYRNRTTVKAWELGEISIGDLLNHPNFITFTTDSHPEYFI